MSDRPTRNVEGPWPCPGEDDTSHSQIRGTFIPESVPTDSPVSSKEALDEVARIGQEHGGYDNPTLWVHPACDCRGRKWSHSTSCSSLDTRPATRAEVLAALDGTYLPWCVEHESPQFARWDERSKWLCQAAWWNDAGGACKFKPMMLVEAVNE